MTDALKVVPSETAVETGVADAAAIADGLADTLADTYRLVFKTHAVHWNVEGPLFHSVHVLTEGQYEEMFTAADELAERIRGLGQLAPHDLSAVMRRSVIEDVAAGMDAAAMVGALAADHAQAAQRMRPLIGKAAEAGDEVTADLLTQRCAFHEKAAWMLRSTAAG